MRVYCPQDRGQAIALPDEVALMIAGLVGMRVEMGQQAPFSAAGLDNPIARSLHQAALIAGS